jgi:hypothetical protein
MAASVPTAGKHSKNQPAAIEEYSASALHDADHKDRSRLAHQSFSLFAGATSNKLREDNNVPSMINRRNRA